MVEGLCGKGKRIGFVLCMFALLALSLPGSAMAGGMRYPVGLSYVSGFSDLADQYKDNLEAEGYFVWDVTEWPVGISFKPYYQWDNGLRLGVDVGPIMAIYGDIDHFQVPLNVNVGYTLNPSDPVSFYVRGGPSYHFASGDYVDGSNLGVMGGVGVELFKGARTALAIEATYDTAEVDIEDVAGGGTKGIRAAEFSVGLFIVFK